MLTRDIGKPEYDVAILAASNEDAFLFERNIFATAGGYQESIIGHIPPRRQDDSRGKVWEE
jgi:hypothetical protein